MTALLIAAVTLAGACSASPQPGGPLEGPRVSAGDVGICAPRVPGSASYFGEPLTNTGTDTIRLSGVSGVVLEHASAEILVDVDGPAAEQLIGAFVWPTQDPIGFEGSVLARMESPQGVELAPNATVAIYVKITPTSEADDAVVSEYEVRYESGGRSYREAVKVTYTVPASGVC